MNVILTENAREDLHEIHDYISNKLLNPIAAKSTVARIRNTYSILSDNPYIGTPLNTKTERETSLRYLVSGRYVIVYGVKDNTVKIMRIRSGRQGNWYFIFGDSLE